MKTVDSQNPEEKAENKGHPAMAGGNRRNWHGRNWGRTRSIGRIGLLVKAIDRQGDAAATAMMISIGVLPAAVRASHNILFFLTLSI